jgi:hypothetical protein
MPAPVNYMDPTYRIMLQIMMAKGQVCTDRQLAFLKSESPDTQLSTVGFEWTNAGIEICLENRKSQSKHTPVGM